jgi:hypothetical protein
VSYNKEPGSAYTSWIPGFHPGLLLGSGCSSLSFLCCVVFVFVLCLVCPNLSGTYLAIFTNFIFICVFSLSRMWRTRVTCFKENHILGQHVCPYLHVQHEQIISLPFHKDRHNYCLRRIASPYDSSSYTHTIMFWLLPFYLLT